MVTFCRTSVSDTVFLSSSIAFLDHRRFSDSMSLRVEPSASKICATDFFLRDYDAGLCNNELPLDNRGKKKRSDTRSALDEFARLFA